MALNILHLSDLHIGKGHIGLKRLPRAISSSLERDDKIHQIVFTGDIFDGSDNNSEDAINSAVNFFKELITQINQRQGSCLTSNDVLFVPGNHEILQNKEDSELFDGYKQFLEQFYDTIPLSIYSEETLTVFKKFDNERIAIVGFNSARYERDGQKTYGEIDLDHRDEIDEWIYKNCPEYGLVVLMHHHFYTIEERDKSYKDHSNVINPESFLSWICQYNVSAILHGHKHDNFIKRINVNDDPRCPDRIVTTIAGGSVDKKDTSVNSFNIVKIYPPEHNLVVDVSEYTKKNKDRFTSTNSYTFPIHEDTKKGTLLTHILNKHDKYQYKWNNVRGFAQDSQKFIELLNSIVSKCLKCSDILEKEKNIPSVAYMYCVAHCCANNASKEVQNTIKSIFELNENTQFDKLYLGLLECKDVYSLKDYFIRDEIQADFKSLNLPEKQRFIFSVLSFYLSSFFYTLTSNSKAFFERELKKRNDIKLKKNYDMTSYVRVNDIIIKSNVERRAVDVEVVCTDPAAHKVISIIINEFESLLSHFEKDFASIGYNMYYIKGLVKSKSQNSFTSHNFSAYMHTLLKLLAGEHIYKEKNVFIRELIQNCIDAINVRKVADLCFTDEGRIDIHYQEIEGKHILEIKDNGVGMTQFHIERYLTTVGRSFYKSEDFENSSAAKKYVPISQFGIGFLSSFNVSKSIEVETKYYDENVESYGKQLDIPSLDGCFFIEDYNRSNIGTTVRLELDIDKITCGEIKSIGDFITRVKLYIIERFLNIPFDIYWNNDRIVSKFNLYYKHQKSSLENKLSFFIPLSDKGELRNR